jgi:hypothetical protein
MKLLIVAVVIVCAPPNYPQCDDPTFARSNPGLCFPGPLGQLPPTGGGGGSGGILGTIGHILHDIGGLL